MTEKNVETFEKWFWVSKGSFKECLKYGIVLGIAQVLLAVLNTLVVSWLGLFEPVLLAENGVVTETFINGQNFNQELFAILFIVLAVVSFVVTFGIVFFGLKKILWAFPKENKIYLAIYILGISLVIVFILISIIAGQIVRPHGLIVQILAAIFAVALAKPNEKLSEGTK